MVHFALTPQGFAEAIALAQGKHAVWCTASAASQEQIAAMQADNVSRFVYTLAELLSDPSQMAGALDTIAQHHPDERIWVEHVEPA